MNNSPFAENPPIPSPHNDTFCGMTTPPPGEKHPLACLLKTPVHVMWRISENENLNPLTAQLFMWGLVFHAIYGFAMALFDSPQVAVITATKAPLIAFFSLLLCIPSLYVFSCVAGLPIRMTQACALAASTVAMTGLILLGMTPVTWLFSVSTHSLPFVVVMNLISWIVAVGFALRFFRILGRNGGDSGRLSGLKWWLFIYILVSLQMTTTMRPLLGKLSSNNLITTEKKFFAAHFKEAMETDDPKEQVKH